MTTTSSVSTTASTSYVSGTISGLDTQSLIDAAVAQKTARADTIDLKVTANEAKISAYQTLQGLLGDIADSLSTLAGATYSALGDAGTAFDEKEAYLTASDGSDATDLLAVSADSDAVAASYSLTIDQLAKAMKVASAAQASTTMLSAGAFSLGAEGGDTTTITVTQGMSVSDLAAAINAQSATTGVAATLVKSAADGDATYQLILSAADTDKAIVTTAFADGADVLTAIGLTTSDGDFATVLQAAQPAILTIDGITVTNASNEFTDTVSGLSLSLLQTTATGQTVTLDIEANYADVKTAVTSFIDAYNALRALVITNQTVGADGSVSDDALLFADNLLRGVSAGLGDILGSSPASADSTIGALADLGVTLDESNNLVLSDETTLDTLLLGNLSSVSAFFQTSFASSDDGLKLLKNATTASLDFTLEVTADTDGAISDVTVGGQLGLFSVSGSRIVGVAGTIYEGLSFALVASVGVTDIDVSIKQGFANRVSTLMTRYADTSSGLIQIQIGSLETTDSRLGDQAEKIRTDAETYRTNLVAKYATMETELYAAQVLQDQIQAILGASSDSSDN